MNYHNEPSDILLPAAGQSSVNVFGTVAFIGEVSVKPGFAVGAVEEALTLVNDNLTKFVTSPTFEADVLTVFGAEADVELGRTIIDALRFGEELPQINVVPAEQMSGVNGGFDSLTGEVYVADTLVARETSPVIARETPPVIASETPPVIASETKQSPNLVDVLTPVIASETPPVIASETKQSPNLVDVLAEELGHYIDSKLNKIDTPGDEGELFAALVGGGVLRVEDVGRLQRENDKVRIFGGLLEVEASGEVSFGSPTNFDAGSSTNSIAVGDFNSDGISDLAATNQASDDVSVLLGIGNGSFGQTASFVAGDSPEQIVVEDFNGDGILDLAIANQGSEAGAIVSDSVSILLGVGNGSFSQPTNFIAADYPISLTLGDFNSDRISDLAVSNWWSDNISVLLGVGNGSFSQPTNFGVSGGLVEVRVGEFNGDGISDLAIANQPEDNVSILLGIGNGSFGEATHFGAGDSPSSITVGEFNGDGISDLAIANWRSNNVSVLLGIGNGSFNPATNFDVGENPTSIVVGEFNDDGISDLAVANKTFNSLSILLGIGNGSFNPATNFSVGGGPTSVAVGEFNGDGLQDLAVTNVSGNISILLNTTPVTTTLPNLTINNTTTREGDTNKTANFQVTLNAKPDETVTVNYTTANQTAIANQDYKPTKGILTFKPGETKKTITVPILGDNKIEPNETFQLQLSNPTNAQLKDKLGIATITNDDKPQPKISIGDAKIVEGNRGRKNAKFPITLDAKPDETVRVNYATANKTAIANQDYKATKGILTFKPGETRKTITVPIFGDTRIENTETFNLNLSKPKNAELKDKSALGTIRDNDFAKVSIKDAQITEGNDGKKQLKFDVTLNAKINERVRVNYATRDDTAKKGSDYQQTKGQLTFKPNQKKKTITVPILGDTFNEDDEKFAVNLSKPSKNIKLGDKRATGTIKDNDEGGDKPGDSFQTAINLGKLTEKEIVLSDRVGYTVGLDRDTDDFYSFQLPREGNTRIILDSLLDDASLTLYGSGEELIFQSNEKGQSSEQIIQFLERGVYYVNVEPHDTSRTDYRLEIKSV